MQISLLKKIPSFNLQFQPKATPFPPITVRSPRVINAQQVMFTKKINDKQYPVDTSKFNVYKSRGGFSPTQRYSQHLRLNQQIQQQNKRNNFKLMRNSRRTVLQLLKQNSKSNFQGEKKRTQNNNIRCSDCNRKNGFSIMCKKQLDQDPNMRRFPKLVALIKKKIMN